MMRLGATLLAAAALALWAGCARDGSALPPPAAAAAAGTHARWIPADGSTYQIQYDGSVETGVPAEIYDLDMFDTPVSLVKKLHAAGRKVICYVDAGTWEDWRPDASSFPKSVLGNPDGNWPGERWLDVAKTRILEPIMEKRFAQCAAKGFDGMDPDNIDGYENDTGFKLTAAEQLTYDGWVARAAHALGLTVAQKNDPGQIAALSNVFDYAVVEQCMEYGNWCAQYKPYVARGALVVDVEYGWSEPRFERVVCAEAAKTGDTAIDKRLSLDAWRIPCR